MRAVVFDLDGTLLDSDAALVAPFVALGVAEADVTFGHVVAEECARLGVPLDAYLAAYEPGRARPFPGVAELLARLAHWAVCSNKHGAIARAELARLRWRPDVACFADDFGGPKRLDVVLDALDVPASDVLFVGDTEHDAACVEAVGCGFAWAGWNPRVAPTTTDPVLGAPGDLLGLLGDEP